jgi:hypothetical protein
MAGLVDACCRAGGQGGGDRRHHWSLLRRRMVAVRRTRRGLCRGSTRERERQRSMRGDARASRRGPVGRRRGGRELACGSVNLPQPAPARSPSRPHAMSHLVPGGNPHPPLALVLSLAPLVRQQAPPRPRDRQERLSRPTHDPHAGIPPATCA